MGGLGGGDALVSAGVLAGVLGASFSCAQIPTLKDEDRFLVLSGAPLAGSCDAVIALFDGHGGKVASDYCQRNLVRVLGEELGHVRGEVGAGAGGIPLPHAPPQPMALSGGKLLLGPPYSAGGAPGTGGGWDGWGPDGPFLDAAVHRAFVRLDGEITERFGQGGSTASVCLLQREGDSTHIKCAWAGDSRAIIVTNGGGWDLSHDHKPEGCEGERVSAAIEEAKQHLKPGVRGDFISQTSGIPRVVSATTGLSLACSRALGDRGKSLAVSPAPDVANATVLAGERARVVLCSDGVWDVVTTSRASTLSFFNTQEDAASAATNLARGAAEGRRRMIHVVGDDDITALVVELHCEAAARRVGASGRGLLAGGT